MMWRDTIEVLTFPTVVERGRSVPDTSAEPTSVVPLTGVDVQPGPSTELEAQRAEGVAVRWTVFVRQANTLAASSFVRYLGAVYQVQGEPARWGAPMAYTVAELVDWK